MSYFSLSSWQPAIMNWVSSWRSSSVSILNFLSKAWLTWLAYSASLLVLRSLSLWAMRSLTCSGVSRLAMNSCSYCLSSAERRAAKLALRYCKFDSFLFMRSFILSLAVFLIILLSLFASHLAFSNMNLLALMALWRVASLYNIRVGILTYSIARLAMMWASDLNLCDTLTIRSSNYLHLTFYWKLL